MLRSQTLANIFEIFQNITPRFSFYVVASRFLFAQLTPALFFSRHIQSPLKNLRWSVFVDPVNNFKLLTVYANTVILDAWRESEYACVQIAPNNVFCHHNKHLMGYLKFLHGSRIICLLLNIPEKLHWQHILEKPEEAETHRHEEQHLPFKQTKTTTIFLFRYQSSTCPRSDPLCWRNPCFGCNSGIDLVVLLEYTFFQLCSNTKDIS